MNTVYCTKCKRKIYAGESIIINKQEFCAQCADEEIDNLTNKLAESLKDKE